LNEDVYFESYTYNAFNTKFSELLTVSLDTYKEHTKQTYKNEIYSKEAKH